MKVEGELLDQFASSTLRFWSTKFTMTLNDESAEGTYSIQGKNLILTVDGEDATATLQEDGILKLALDDSTFMTFAKSGNFSPETDGSEATGTSSEESDKPSSSENATGYSGSDDDSEVNQSNSSDAVSSMTTGQKNALRTAEDYLKYSAFSYTGLIDQLEYEEYSHEEAVFAADHCGADWNKQALKSAKSYLEYTAFSYTGLIEQLEFEGFTSEQAKYAVDHCGADWNEQAAKCAESYLEYSAFSKSRLIAQLEYEGFTHEEAVYGAEKNGY